MKVTTTISKQFFNLIKDEKTDRFDQLMAMLKQYPELANGIVKGMAKGIDGFSALMLAVRYYNFQFAIKLIEAGADVNYIDNSPARQNYNPVFFDLLEMLKNLIEAGKIEHLKVGLSVWDSMESHGLDYSKKSIEDDGVNEPENCLEAFIRIASTEYANKHKIYYDSDKGSYELSEKDRNIKNEEWYELMMERIINRISKDLVKELDANRHRDSGNVFETSPGNFEIIDYFSLELANKYINQKFDCSIKNIDDIGFMDDYKDYAEKTYT